MYSHISFIFIVCHVFYTHNRETERDVGQFQGHAQNLYIIYSFFRVYMMSEAFIVFFFAVCMFRSQVECRTILLHSAHVYDYTVNAANESSFDLRSIFLLFLLYNRELCVYVCV